MFQPVFLLSCLRWLPETQWSQRSTCLQVRLHWSMVATILWWPPALLSGPGPLLKSPGSPTCLASQKCNYLMKSTARPAHKCATSGSPHVTSRAMHLPVWSATQRCRTISGSPTNSTCSVRHLWTNHWHRKNFKSFKVRVNLWVSKLEGLWNGLTEGGKHSIFILKKNAQERTVLIFKLFNF